MAKTSLQQAISKLDTIKNKYIHQTRRYDYRKAQMDTLFDIYCQLIDLPQNELISIERISQIEAIINQLMWYNADLGIDHLLFQAYRLIHPTATKSAKQLVKRYQYGMDIHNEDYDASAKYSKTHHDYGYCYALITDELILDFLWNQPKVRHLILSWYEAYVYYKRHYGMEDRTELNCNLHYTNQVFQLLRGVNDDTTMYLPSYKRNPKRQLSQHQWKHAMRANSNIFVNLWD